jgi:hypothetical protein
MEVDGAMQNGAPITPLPQPPLRIEKLMLNVQSAPPYEVQAIICCFQGGQSQGCTAGSCFEHTVTKFVDYVPEHLLADHHIITDFVNFAPGEYIKEIKIFSPLTELQGAETLVMAGTSPFGICHHIRMYTNQGRYLEFGEARNQERNLTHIKAEPGEQILIWYGIDAIPVTPHFSIKKSLAPTTQITMVGIGMGDLIHGICFKHEDLSITGMVLDEDQEEIDLYSPVLEHRVAWTKLEKGDFINKITGTAARKGFLAAGITLHTHHQRMLRFYPEKAHDSKFIFQEAAAQGNQLIKVNFVKGWFKGVVQVPAPGPWT